MKMLAYIDSDYNISSNDTFLCPKCHGIIEYNIVSSKTEVAKYHWICQSCCNTYEQYELKVLLVNMPKPTYKEIRLYGN